MFSRLELVDPGLAALVERVDDPERRRIAVAAAEFAKARAQLDHPSIDALHKALADGRVGATLELRNVDQLVVQLDEQYWDLQDQVEAGAASEAEMLRAFALARAATAFSCAAESDARVAALEAVYEAHIAVDDLDALREAIALD